MVSQQLLDYVKKELARGVHEDKLRQTLLENDWPEFEINEAFEKTKQAKPVKPAGELAEEKLPEEILKEEIPVEEPKESVPEEKHEAVKKVSIIENVQKIVTNKIFIIAAMIIILGSVVYFIILPLVFEGEGIGANSSVTEEAKNACTQYCNSNLCGLFVSPEFPQPELNGKNCLDLGVQCKKCEVEY
jgi:outer membrane biosynthesis protein TonB